MWYYTWNNECTRNGETISIETALRLHRGERIEARTGGAYAQMGMRNQEGAISEVWFAQIDELREKVASGIRASWD